MAEAKNEGHQSPLNLRGRGYKTARLSRQRQDYRQTQEDVHRNEDNEHSVPADGDQVVLRRKDEEAQNESPVIGGPGLEQRQVFLERPETEEREEDQRRLVTKRQDCQEYSRHEAPGPHPRRKLGIIFLRLYSAQDGHTAGRRREQSENHQAHLSCRREVRNETVEYHCGHGHPPIV